MALCNESSWLPRNVEETRVHVFEEKHVDDGFYRCLLSESIDVYSEEKQPLSIPTEITTKHTNFILRNDLFDCNIDICTQEVPSISPYIAAHVRYPRYSQRTLISTISGTLSSMTSLRPIYSQSIFTHIRQTRAILPISLPWTNSGE